MRLAGIAVVTLAVALAAVSGAARADELSDLRERLEVQEQKIRVLERKLELVARYHELDIDDDAFLGGTNSFANPDSSASKASAWGVGVNWYLNQNYKWSLNYDVTSFAGGAPGGADRPDQQAVFTRFAVQF